MKFITPWEKLKSWIENKRPVNKDWGVGCVCGMHRSGTSMAAQLLSRCGVYMGPKDVLTVSAADNQDGFWEDDAFVGVNEELLRHFFGGWDLPPRLQPGWESADEISALRERARDLIEQRRIHRFWGWKDPRTSITLPFWRSLIPELKVVICLRHPWEVAQSLHRRNYMSIPFGLTLWEAYQKLVLAGASPANRLITHYNSHFHDPRGELERILAFLGRRISPAALQQAVATCKDRLRNNRYEAGLAKIALPQSIAEIYSEMCAQAGPVYADAMDPKYGHCLLEKSA
jgi:hypothetical protein